MKHKLLLLVCFLLCTLTSSAFRPHRFDAFKAARVNENSIVFIGNSITNMHDWHSAFDNHNLCNRGVYGTNALETLANLESYIAGKPAKVFMMLGTNDIAPNNLNHSPEQVVGNIRKIVDRIQNESPKTEIHIAGLFPSEYNGRTLESLQTANALIKALCEEKNLTYIDLFDDLMGILDNTHSQDGLHLSMSGNRIWANKIAGYVGSACIYPADMANQYPDGISNASYKMRASNWAATPIKADDVLMIGDEMINAGEWHELLNCGNVKNYGQAWGYPGPWLEETIKMLPLLFDGRDDNVDPKQVFLYAGVQDLNGTGALSTMQTRYQDVVNKIRELAPTTKINMMSLQPTSNASTNTNRIEPFNAWMKTLAESEGNAAYVDIYTGFENANGVGDSKYFNGNYLYALGYAKVAGILAPMIEGASAMSETEAEAHINLINARNTLGSAISNLSDLPFGDAMGQYPSEKKAIVEAAISKAYDLLNKEGVTIAELEAGGTELTATVGSIKTSINQPKASTAGEEHWYKITSPLRGNRTITSTGAGAGIMGYESHNYATAWWKFTLRNDDTYNIINRADGSYVSPTAANDTQLMTSAAEPANGWTLSAGDEGGLYIITSGTVQFNQTQSGLGWKLYNWGDGTNTNDSGCQLKIEEVTGEPDEVPAAPDTTSKSLIVSAADLTTGDQIILVAPSSSCDGEFFNGSSVKTAANSFGIDNIFQVEFKESSTAEFYLKQYSSGQYIGIGSASGNFFKVSLVEALADAAAFTIMPNAQITNISAWGTDLDEAEKAAAVRFETVDKPGYFLNVQTSGAAPVYSSGLGSWSVWVAYKLDGGNVTGLSSALNPQLPADAPVYDLSGRRVANPGHGIFIVNGKKVVK